MDEIEGPVGRLEARWDITPNVPPRAVAVVASPHPQYGGTMQDRVIYHATQGLLRVGCAVLRFNYRGVGTSAGAFDDGTGEMDDYRAALDAAAARFPNVPIWAIGYSFGAHKAMVAGANDPRVELLLGIAALVDTDDYAAVRTSDKPKLLVHGERDEMCPLKTIRRFYGELEEPRELVIIDMADHFFDGHTSEVADAVEDLLGE
jgi:uncharacterized protein